MPLRLPFGLRFGERALKSRKRPGTASDNLSSLAWIDDFFRQSREHIFAREEDGVVILPPNQVYKANATGVAIVRHMLAGGKVSDIPGIEDEERARQVAAFVSDVRNLYLDLPAEDGRAPYETVPYSFQYTTLPILGEIAVTYRCNNACAFCYAGCGTHLQGCGTQGCGTQGCGTQATPLGLSGGKEMTLSEIERVIRIFKEEARIPFFSFTGGEPLLRTDLEDMIRFARHIGLQVNLITNGTLATPRRAASLYRAGLRTAQVSLESLEPETHDALTARPGSHRKTLEGIRALQKAGISVQTNTTVTARNAVDASRMPAFLKGIGVSRFAMNLYLPPSSVDGTAETAQQLFVPYTRTGAIIEGIRASARAADMVFYWYSPIPHCHYNTIARGLGNKSCAAMDGLVSVSASGDVLPCSSYPECMGNLLTDDFRKIWFSDRARFFKNKDYAPPECAGCDSFTACQAACPLYWRYAGTSEIRNPTASPRATAGEREA
jgi:radical SAM protein with 4Fe4S-binding SPASM domain